MGMQLLAKSYISPETGNFGIKEGIMTAYNSQKIHIYKSSLANGFCFYLFLNLKQKVLGR